jgi:hypothetical protein
MVLTAAAASLHNCLLILCAAYSAIIAYLAFPYASSLAHQLNVALSLSEAKHASGA